MLFRSRPVDPRENYRVEQRPGDPVDGQPSPPRTPDQHAPHDPRADHQSDHHGDGQGDHHQGERPGDQQGDTGYQGSHGDHDTFGSSESRRDQDVLDQIGRDADATLHEHPEAASVVKKLTEDDNPLNMTDALTRPATRQATLDTIKELADGRVLIGRAHV